MNMFVPVNVDIATSNLEDYLLMNHDICLY